jgi:hypothetical protein
MNERIKQLAEQAGLPLIHDKFMTASQEKFALLIVQECADIGQQYADGNYEVYNQILEHFGVEE